MKQPQNIILHPHPHIYLAAQSINYTTKETFGEATMNRPIVFLTILAALLSSSGLSEPDPDLELDPAPVAPSCVQVTTDVVPCLSFIRSRSVSQPSVACCSGVKGFNNDAKSPSDRQAICQCLKNSLANAGNYDKNRIPLIPQKCGVSVSLPPIDAKTDCSKAYA